MDVREPLLGETAPGRRRRQSSPGGLAITDIHLPSNLTHHVDHLVDRDREGDAGQRHLDSCQRDRRTRRIAKNARQFDESAQRIANKPQRSLHRKGHGVSDLRRRSAQHLRCCSRGHPGRGARLRLTTSFGARQRRAFSHYRSNQSCRCQTIDDLVVSHRARFRQPSKNRGKNTRATCRRRGDDHSHRRIHLLHREGAGENVTKRGLRQRSIRILAQLRGIAPHKSGCGMKISR